MDETLEEKVFARMRPDYSKLEKYGWLKKGDSYVWDGKIMEGAFSVQLELTSGQAVTGHVVDLMNEEEYAALRSPARSGTYVSRVRAAYEQALREAAAQCFIPVYFASGQANRIAKVIEQAYGVKPDFPWKENPHRTTGVFRHPETAKWFGLVLYLPLNKIVRAAEPRPVNVMNLKIDPDQGGRLRRCEGIYEAYHMNHKLWITALLDDTLSDEFVLELIAESHRLTLGK